MSVHVSVQEVDTSFGIMHSAVTLFSVQHLQTIHQEDDRVTHLPDRPSHLRKGAGKQWLSCGHVFVFSEIRDVRVSVSVSMYLILSGQTGGIFPASVLDV